MCATEPNAPNAQPQRNWLDIAISLVQPVSIIIGGCWIAFLYFTYQEKSDAVSLQEKQLSVQQASIVLQTQAQSNQLDVDLKKIAADQARIALDTQKNERELKSTQLAAEVALKKQEVSLNKLKEKQQEHDVQYSNNYRSSVEMDLWATKLRKMDGDRNEYKITLLFALKNESTVTYEISYISVQYFLGKPKPGLTRHVEDVEFSRLGFPPSLVNQSAESGALDWYELDSPSGSIFDEARGNMGEWDFVERETPDLKGNGANTGNVEPGVTTQFVNGYIVRGKPGTHLGFVVNWIINRAKGGVNDVHFLNRIIQLPEDDAEVKASEKKDLSE